MKTTLACLLIAIIFRLAFEVSTAQDAVNPKMDMSHELNLYPKITPNLYAISFTGGAAKEWLKVERHNVRDYEERGFDACYTDITSYFKPIVKKLPSGKYEITFVSEIAEKLP